MHFDWMKLVWYNQSEVSPPLNWEPGIALISQDSIEFSPAYKERVELFYKLIKIWLNKLKWENKQ